MATDEEITRLWNGFPEKIKQTEAIVRLYRLAEGAGKQEGIAAVEKELVTDTTLEAAMQTFGWGGGRKSSIITLRAIVREAVRLAKEKVK